ncbi:MAG: iron-containing alcohol dehydrogenase [Alphaproteobacteria bacterium]
MDPFIYDKRLPRTVFGPGTAKSLGDELDRLLVERALILCSPGRAAIAQELADSVGDNRAAVSPVSTEGMPQDAYDLLKADVERTGAEALVALGGGSPIGLGKAWAAETGHPMVAVVTTYSGSEMQNNWYIGDTLDRVQGASDTALPRTAIYDPDLTMDLPAKVSAASGMNAMAHAVETLYGPNTNSVLNTLAEDAIRRLGQSLPKIVDDPSDRAARHDALYAAWLAAAFRARAGLEHALAQRVRSRFTLNHAECHAISVPYAIAANATAASDAMEIIEHALGVEDAGTGLWEFNRRLGLNTGFGALGMPEDGIDEIADILDGMTFANPVAMDRSALRDVVAQAWAGETPSF